ncbi:MULTISPECIES: spore germination protein [Paenibacillus]|uniref:spore germination protein n=1 Tax=Paenibacillus TaxID=44249 RepID=UPI00119FD064|nr:spore germination protein [Paenibacillus sp. IHBB 10380]
MLRYRPRGRRFAPRKDAPGQEASRKIAGIEPADHLQEHLDRIRTELGNSPDIIFRQLKLGGASEANCAIVYLNGLSDPEMINHDVMESLLQLSKEFLQKERSPADFLDMVMKDGLAMGESRMSADWNEAMLAILSGDTVILFEGADHIIIAGTQGGQWRSVTEPTSQLVVRGPKDSFVESIATNISLIRRRLKSSRLWLETMKIGSVTHTHVAIMYVKGKADPGIVREIKDRLNRIEIEGILESAYIEEFIQDKTITPFPTIYNTERPDDATSKLLEGRIVVLVDGTPFVLVLPTVFAHFFQSPEDYAQRFDIAIVMRLVRYISFIILILGPSVYIALTTFHYEMVPTQLLISLVAQREGVPFPAFIEAMLMEVVFEILREAGVRMPRAIGKTVSVVGALILGQAVVEAGLITPAMVIVVALTGIASFTLPAYNLSIAGRLIRFGFMVLSGMFGFYGLTLGVIVLIAHMNSLRSFGVPFMSPISPFRLRNQKDAIIRLAFQPLQTQAAESSTGFGASSNQDTSLAGDSDGRMSGSGQQGADGGSASGRGQHTAANGAGGNRNS